MIKAYFSNIKDVLLQNIQFSKQSINVAVAWFTQRELFVAILDALDRGVSVSIILIDDIINRNEYGLDFSLLIRKGGNLRFADSWKSWRGGKTGKLSVQKVYQFLLHLVVNLPVPGKGTAALRMSRHGGYQVRILDLSVQVADEGFACGMCGRHFV